MAKFCWVVEWVHLGYFRGTGESKLMTGAVGTQLCTRALSLRPLVNKYKKIQSKHFIARKTTNFTFIKKMETPSFINRTVAATQFLFNIPNFLFQQLCLCHGNSFGR